MLLVHHARTALITQAAEAADLGPDRAPRPPNRRRYGGLSPEDWNNALPHVLASITAKINSARRGPELPACGQTPVSCSSRIHAKPDARPTSPW